MKRTLIVTFLVALLPMMSIGAARAQRRVRPTRRSGAGSPSTVAQLASQVTRLEQQLADLKKSTTMVPTLAGAVQKLSARLEVIVGELDVVRKQQASVPDAVNRLDDLDARLRAVEKHVARLATELASTERPAIGAQGALGEATSGGGVVYKGGFTWSTADGKRSLTLGGYAQFRHETRVNEDLDDVLATGLRMRRARLSVAGQLGEKDSFYVLFSLLQDTALLDYYLDHEITKSVIVRVGQYKVQHGRSFITSSKNLAFLERSVGVDAYRYPRDFQVGLHGVFAGDRLGYYAGVGNGSGDNRVNDNIDLMLSARMDAVVFGERFSSEEGDLHRTEKPALMVGASVVHDLVAVPDTIEGTVVETTDVDANGERDNVRVISAAFDATFRYRGLELTAEAQLRYEKWGTIFQGNPMLSAAVDGARTNRNHVGFFGQATYMALPEHLLVGARAGHWRLPFLGLGARPSQLPVADRVFEVDLLVQLYGERGRMLGLQYTYNDYNAKDGPAPQADKFHRVILEGQLAF